MKTNILRSRLTPLILALAMALVLPLAIAKPADAAWPCASGYVCFYEHANYDGIVMNHGNPSPGCHNVGAQFNDIVSSIHNYSSRHVRLYKHINCDGGYCNIPVGESAANLASGPWVFNDTMSSYRVY